MRYYCPVLAGDVTDEIREAAAEVVQSHYGDEGQVDWLDVWDRLDGHVLADGSILDLGNDANTFALQAIKRYIRKARQTW